MSLCLDGFSHGSWNKSLSLGLRSQLDVCWGLCMGDDNFVQKDLVFLHLYACAQSSERFKEAQREGGDRLGQKRTTETLQMIVSLETYVLG